jgi:enoyl-[acyl-carrier-protein] reductase (NADH)
VLDVDDATWQRYWEVNVLSGIRLSRYEPEEIANLVAYVSSEQASATTGGALRVDGGYVDYILP